MDTCLFCKIVKKEVPSYKIYEDEEFIGFLDVFPRAKGHALIIPKKHYRWVYDVPNFGEYWEAAKVTAQKIQIVLGSKFISFLTSGLDLPHAHIHILPDGNGMKFTEVKKVNKEELEKLAKDILHTK